MPNREDTSEITIAFLDVGQGDSTVIVLPDLVTAIVVDCARQAAGTIDYLTGRGITTLDYIFVTHTDSDHIGGAVGLAQNFTPSIGILHRYDSPRVVSGKRRTILRALLQLAREHGLKTRPAQSGDRWTFDDLVIEVLHPSDHDAKEAHLNDDTNNASMILRASFHGHRALLAADVQGQGWQWILERNTDLKADILKFPHHGGWYDCRNTFPSLGEVLRQIAPTLVVISVGTHNSYNHPSIETLDLLRSQPQLRFVCTEATPRCHSPLRDHDDPCPCAGTVEVALGDGTMDVSPDRTKHAKTMANFDAPKCTAGQSSAQQG